jgi:sugar (pentulose or hexulose) kinase
MNEETGREELLAALVRGLCEYQRRHLEEISSRVPLADEIFVTGGALNDALIQAKRLWLRDCAYRSCEQSSLRGAALLALEYLQRH